MTRPAPLRYRLTRSAPPTPGAPVLDAAALQVVANPGGALRVLAGPGTGKTTTLVEAVVERVRVRGVPVEQILVLTFGRRAAAELRDRITARLGGTVREPVARTIHSYAYGVLRLAALREQLPAPRLLVAAEQDVVLRELLTAPASAVAWPPELLPALRTRGFADELRDFLSRAVERGIDPVGLDELAGRYARPDWAAAAQFLQQYRDVTSFQRPGSFDTAELVAGAIVAFNNDSGLLADERARRRHIFVDEYQDVDPAQAELLRLLAGSATEFVVVGDPDQSIYAFRGSEPRALDDVEDAVGQLVPTVALSISRRSGATLLEATRRVAKALGHDSTHHELVPAPDVAAGEVAVHVFRSSADEGAAVAAALRRAHLEQGLPWARMAVLVRSVTQSGAVLRRALVTAGVPVEVVGDDVPLAEAGVVDALLRALSYTLTPPADPVVADAEVEALLLGPLGRADVLVIRRLRRALSREAGTRPDDLPPGRLATVVERVEYAEHVVFGARYAVARLAHILAAGRAAGPDLEPVLWALWEASGLSARWERASVTGGLAGQAADRELDAVVELLEAAARFTDAFQVAAASEFVTTVRAQLLPVRRDAGQNPDVVRLLTAHASKGLEWDLVWVAGVQEGLWPDLRRRGTVLGADVLTDVVSGQHSATTDQVAIALAEERRLFYVAVTRARRRLVVSAVHDAQDSPSRFLNELDPLAAGREAAPEPPPRPLATPPRGLHLAALVAELRAVVTDPGARPELRHEAAAGLASLAAGGVAGADPAQWWGLLPLSSDGPIRDPAAGPVRVSPSKLESYQRCQLQALLGELGARDGEQPVSASLGTVVHAVAADAPDLSDVADLERRLDDVWRVLDFEAPWHAAASRRAASQFLVRLSRWFQTSRAAGLTELGTELGLAVAVGDDAVLAGQVDRLELDAEGRTVVVDLKTTSTKAKGHELAEHPQLAAYQLAVSLGAFDAVPGATRQPGGGLLLQLKAGSAGSAEQWQPALADPGPVVQAVAELAGVLRGARLLAKVNDRCDRCAVRSCCPAVPTGRQVTT